jgi:hypothetical protein
VLRAASGSSWLHAEEVAETNKAGDKIACPTNYYCPPVRDAPDSGLAKATSACVAQLVADAEIHWSCPNGNPLSKYGWMGMARVFTCHDPSSNCEFSRNRTPR